MKKATNGIHHPRSHFNFPKKIGNESVVDGVKGFSGVQEKNPEFFLLLEMTVIEIDEAGNMLPPVSPGEESFLRFTNQLVKAGGYGVGDGLGKHSIYGIRDGDGAGVTGKESVFLGEKDHPTMVEPSRGRESPAQVEEGSM